MCFSLSIVETYIAVFIGSVANGIIYVSGLSYVNIRSSKKQRAQKHALCHAWKVIGFALVYTLHLYIFDGTTNTSGNTLAQFYRIIGYILVGSNGVFLLLIALNEIWQRQSIVYNYLECLDHDNAIANSYCKLFSKNEVIIERNLSASTGSWKSTENLLPKDAENYTNLWTFYMMIPKLHGVILFHYILLMMSMAKSAEYFDWTYSRAITVWIMALGAIFGCFLLRFFHSAKVYALSAVCSVIALSLVFAFYKAEFQSTVVFLWLFFFFASLVVAVPDLALMELSKIRFCEGALAVGYFVEIVPIAVLQSLQREAFVDTHFDWYVDKYLLTILVSSIVVPVIIACVYQLHLPNTHQKSLLQIQNELLKYNKYFVFDFDFHVNVPASPRRTSEINHYSAENIINVFESHNQNMSSPQSQDYAEIMNPDRLPKTPTNNVQKEYDYAQNIPKPVAIIPRVNISSYKSKSSYN